MSSHDQGPGWLAWLIFAGFAVIVIVGLYILVTSRPAPAPELAPPPAIVTPS